MERLVTMVLLLSVCACATSQLSPEVRRAAAAVKLLDGPPAANQRVIGEVQALSCARQIGANPDMAAAREQLKVEAARRGGNAVASIVCQEEGASLGDNCWKAIRCTGDAIAEPQ